MTLRRLGLFALVLLVLLPWLELARVAPDPFPPPPSGDAPPPFPAASLFASPWVALAFHFAAAGLFGAFAARRFGRPFLGVATAALFAVHPFATEVVACAVHGPLALAMFFLALAAFALRRPAPRRDEWTGAAISFLFALMVAVPALVRGWTLASAAWASDPAWTRADGAANAAWLFLRSVRLMVMPWPLNIAPAADPIPAFSTRFWLGYLWLGGVLWGGWAFRKSFPELSCGLLWLVAAHIPFSNVVLLPQPLADRYLYFMTPGAALAIAALVARHDSPGSRRAGLVFLVILFALLTRARVRQWRSPEALWSSAALYNPASISAHLECARLRELAGDPEGAAAFREEARHLVLLRFPAAAE